MPKIKKTKVGSEYRVRTNKGKIKGEYNTKRMAKKKAENLK